jgi:LPXTG-motif cell wall-anchored protein
MGVASAFVVATAGPSLAEGDETLGTPAIDIADGTGVAVGGVGLFNAGSGTLSVDVPDGATVKQVLLYWEGHVLEGSEPDSTAVVAGTEVSGTPLASAPQYFYEKGGPVSSQAYRADITELGLVAAGESSLEISGLEFSRGDDNVSNGAGVVVIYDDGSGATTVDLRDGVDLAFSNAPGDFPPPRDTTVPQTYEFAPADVERTATFSAFASSVFDANGNTRPNAVKITVGDEESVIENPFSSADGGEWDSVQAEIAIPAGVSSVTVQALSVHDDTNARPASLVWSLGALIVSPPEVPPTTAPPTTAPPTTAPPTTAPPVVTTAPPTTAPTTTTTVPATTTTTRPEGELPRTGSNSTMPLVAAGLALVAVGGGVLLGVRRFRGA